MCGQLGTGRPLRIEAATGQGAVVGEAGGYLVRRRGGSCALPVSITVKRRGYFVSLVLIAERSATLSRRVSARVSEGTARHLYLTLTREARRQLARQRMLRARLSMSVLSSGGVRATVSRTVRLKQAKAVVVSFHETGSEQTFTVPAGVHEVYVKAVGAAGLGIGNSGGAGARVTADLRVHPAEILYVEVGGTPPADYASTGGYNGGGSADFSGFTCAMCSPAGGGGGASDIRTVSSTADGSLASRLLIAGGGGGGGTDYGRADPAAMGGNAGAAGRQLQDGGRGGQPGTQSSGGAGGTGSGNGSPGSAGSLGTGGTGGEGGPPNMVTTDSGGGSGGGGGGGLYGGGGGGGGAAGKTNGQPSGGGGGGSSLVPIGGKLTIAPKSDPPLVTIAYII